MRIVTVIGARPQFIKAAPFSAIARNTHEEVLVHTGQHYHDEMSRVFFDELAIPMPDYNLNVGSGTHGVQTGAMLSALDGILHREQPDVILVYGDTNSTLAGALAGSKMNIPIAHVEAGLRSGNRQMPEELNRIVTDHLSSLLLVPSDSAREQLASEGITDGVHNVGDIMYDAVLMYQELATSQSSIQRRLGLEPGSYLLATVHRAENTDRPPRLAGIVRALNRLSLPVVLPLHPRTKKMLEQQRMDTGPNVHVIDPVGYLDMLSLMAGSACVLTDSGGLQKEAYYLEVRCVTLRDETEWRETIETGWNILAGADPDLIVGAVEHQLDAHPAHPNLYGDGTAALQILRLLEQHVGA